MDAKNIGNSRQRLSAEYQNLVQAINRNRLAAKELAGENTEDEYDLATISQNRELLYDLHEGDFQRLRSIQEALKTIDSGQYGECVRCGEDIKEKRLRAVSWTTLCIRCQERKRRNTLHHVSCWPEWMNQRRSRKKAHSSPGSSPLTPSVLAG